MLPLYLPLVTDGEPAGPELPIMAPGISLYLQQKIPLFRILPRWLYAFLDKPSWLRKAAKRVGMTSARDLGEMTLGSMDGIEGPQGREWGRVVQWALEEVKPDVVSLSNGLLIGMAEAFHEAGVPVIVSLQGEDSFLDTLQEPWRSRCWEAMREKAKFVTKFVAVSHYYSKVMRERLHLPAGQVAPLANGLDLSDYQPGPVPSDPPVIGYLARQCMGKGLQTLVEAFLLLCAGERVPGVRLRIVGTKTPVDEPLVDSLKERIGEAGLADRVEWHSNVTKEEKIRLLQDMTVFSVPATYGEAFGLYVIEALASGVPVVQPDHGGFPEIVKRTGGGVLCHPDDTASLASQWESLLLDEPRRRQMADRGRKSVLEYYSADRMASDFEALCRQALEG
jgi:glycosyltransferase involved in cell wall biosynthesis